jgi:hypothetical protein
MHAHAPHVSVHGIALKHVECVYALMETLLTEVRCTFVFPWPVGSTVPNHVPLPTGKCGACSCFRCPGHGRDFVMERVLDPSGGTVHVAPGGMAGKVAEAGAIAQLGIPVIIAKAATDSGALACRHGPQVLDMFQETWRGTVIEQGVRP